MAILTKTGNPVKGSDYTIQLNKADLIANADVQADSYFNTFDVWKTIAVHYKSTTGNQSINLIFDATQATPLCILNLPEVTLGNFEVKSVIIYDFDNGYFQIPRSSLTTAEFDITVDGSEVGGFNPDETHPDLALSNSNYTITATNSGSFDYRGSTLNKGRISGTAQSKSYFEINLDADNYNGNEIYLWWLDTNELNTFDANPSASLAGASRFGRNGSISQVLYIAPKLGAINFRQANSVSFTDSFSTFASLDVIQIAFSIINETSFNVWIGKNGTWLSGDPSTDTGGFAITKTDLSKNTAIIGAAIADITGEQWSLNQTAAYTIPTGYDFIG